MTGWGVLLNYSSQWALEASWKFQVASIEGLRGPSKLTLEILNLETLNPITYKNLNPKAYNL